MHRALGSRRPVGGGDGLERDVTEEGGMVGARFPQLQAAEILMVATFAGRTAVLPVPP